MTASAAMLEAKAARVEIATHERECAIRYENVLKCIGEIKAILRWVAITAVGALITLGIWGFENWASATSANERARAEQLTALQNQIRTIVSAQAQRSPAVVVATPSPTVQTAPAADPILGGPVQ